MEENTEESLATEEMDESEAATRTVVPLASGLYFINNMKTRCFLGHNTEGNMEVLSFASGQVSSLEDLGCVWELQYTSSGYYYIKNTFANSVGVSTTYYLQYSSQSNSSNEYLAFTTLPTDVNYAHWQIVQESGGYRIINRVNQTAITVNPYINPCLRNGSFQYVDNSCWRIVSTNEYEAGELTSFSIPADEYSTSLYGGVRFAISQTTPSNTGSNVAMFADFDDFRFRGNDSGTTFDSQSEDSRPVFEVNKLGNMFTIKPYEVFRLDITMEHIPSGLTDTFTLHVNPGSGEYIIRSAYAGNNFYIKRLDVAFMCAYQGYDGSASHGIRLVSGGSGYFYLKTDNGYYLTANSSNIVSANPNNTGGAEQLWRIIPTSHNRVCIQPKSNANVVLKMLPLTPYGSLTLGAYTKNSTYDDEWQMQIKDIPTFAVPGVNSADGRDLSRALNQEQSATSFGFANTFRYINADWCMTTMRESNFFVFGGHGNVNRITIDAANNLELTSQQLLQLGNNALSSTELVLYLACYCGQGGVNGNNLVTTTAALGAQTVIGFTIAINTSESILWAQYFVEALLDAYSISYAMSKADEELRRTNITEYTTAAAYRVVIGDISTNPYM